jgi:hypothetical protein
MIDKCPSGMLLFPLETYHILLSSITLHYVMVVFEVWRTPSALPFFIKYYLDFLPMVVYSCKKCGGLNYLTPTHFGI